MSAHIGQYSFIASIRYVWLNNGTLESAVGKTALKINSCRLFSPLSGMGAKQKVWLRENATPFEYADPLPQFSGGYSLHHHTLLQMGAGVGYVGEFS